jgi:hypothetical protein
VIVERIPHIADMVQSTPYPNTVVRGIMPIKVLRESRAVQEAIRKGNFYDEFYGS